MRRNTLYVMRNGKLVELSKAHAAPSESKSAYVHDDTMPELEHPVTKEKVNSKSRWNAINKAHGLKVVGNDLLSKRKHELREKITDERILNAIEKAESIHSDPSRLRAALAENQARIERRNKLLYGN